MSQSKPHRSRLPLPTYRVRLARHDLDGGRWTIPASHVTLPAADSEQAKLLAVQAAHTHAGCPAWRPLVRESLQHATAARRAGW